MGHEMYHFGRSAIGHYYYLPTLNCLICIQEWREKNLNDPPPYCKAIYPKLYSLQMEGYGIYNNVSLSALQMLHTIFGQDCPSTS